MTSSFKNLIFLLALFAVLSPANILAVTTVGVNLPRMVEDADVAFTGVCLEKETKVLKDSQFPAGILATTYTFQILESLKGNLNATFIFTQWGGGAAEARAKGLPVLREMPDYEVGREYVLFLTAESSLGLRSPIGLSQGRFSLLAGPKGEKLVQNSGQNRQLFQNLSGLKPSAAKALQKEISEQPGPMKYEDFRTMIKELTK